jgi:hypothetical protein
MTTPISPEDREKLKAAFVRPLSVESHYADAEWTPWSLCINSFEEDLISEIEVSQQMESVLRAVDKIDDPRKQEQCRQIIILRTEGFTPTEVMKATGLSRQSQLRRLESIGRMLSAA